MDLNFIKQKFKDRQVCPNGNYKLFSVFVPIVKVEDQLELLFQVRSKNLKHQPSEICFPGGKLEKNESFSQCAIRETCEELNISENQLSIITPLDYLVLPYDFIIYPFLGTLSKNVSDIQFNSDEVADIFTVPIDFFIKSNPLLHHVDFCAHMHENFPFHMIPQGRDYKWRKGKYPVLFYEYKDHIIWGMTARIIHNFIHIIANHPFPNEE